MAGEWNHFMQTVLAIMRRDIQGFFYSPIAYILLAVQGFFLGILMVQDLSISYLSFWIATLMLLICPAIAMRSFSEEKKTRTLTLLLTLPVKDWEIVWGKYLACLVTFTLLLASTLLYPFFMQAQGLNLGWGYPTAYTGLWLLGASYLAAGLFISSLTENQIISAVVTFILLLLLWALDQGGSLTNETTRRLLDFLCLRQHFESFRRGYLDLRDFVFFFSFIALFLFLSVRSLEGRKWK